MHHQAVCQIARITGVPLLILATLVFFSLYPNPLDSLIPKGMPEVAMVQTFYEPASECTLIHVRQTHSYPIVGVELAPDQKEHQHQVQKEMHAIAVFFHTNLQVNSFYVEGVTPENLSEQLQVVADWKEDEKLVAQANEFHKAVRELTKLSNALQGGLGLKPSNSKPQKTSILLEEKFTEYLTTCKLVAEAGMELRPAETKILNDTAVKTLTDAAIKAVRQKDTADLEKVAKDDPRMFDHREYETLRILARDYGKSGVTNRHALLFFGGKHDWKDNVQKWNKTNLFKFSLVTITPKSY